MKPPRIILFVVITLLSACTHPASQAALVGSAAGGVAGVALANSTSSKAIFRSVARGAAIGVPVGVAAYYIVDETQKRHVLRQNASTISGNEEKIIHNDNEIAAQYQFLLANSPEISPDEKEFRYVYVGQKLGNPR